VYSGVPHPDNPGTHPQQEEITRQEADTHYRYRILWVQYLFRKQQSLKGKSVWSKPPIMGRFEHLSWQFDFAKRCDHFSDVPERCVSYLVCHDKGFHRKRPCVGHNDLPWLARLGGRKEVNAFQVLSADQQTVSQINR
jgi:hypothetical protein